MSSVDSENSFGGNLRSLFSCTVTLTEPPDTWHLDDFVFLDGADR